MGRQMHACIRTTFAPKQSKHGNKFPSLRLSQVAGQQTVMLQHNDVTHCQQADAK
jgi:hypothetical protein